jgi:hypothetical protein
MEKYFSIRGVIAYLTFASIMIIIVHKYALGKIVHLLTDKRKLWLVAFSFLILFILLVFVYPLANSGLLGRGSDRDDALNIATSELLRGNYPYYLTTYFGNPITPMPGSLILAIPFVLIGNSAYQNLFWLFVFLITINSLFHNKSYGVIVFFTLFLLAPCVMQEFVTGGDLLANSLYIFVFIVWAVIVITNKGKAVWTKILIGILLGLGLSSRSNFVMLLPLIFSAYVIKIGWKSAIYYSGISVLTFIFVTLPFYLYDPQGFSPLHTY